MAFNIAGLNYQDLMWRPDFDINELHDLKNYFLISVDIAEGKKRDSSVIQVFQIVPIPVEARTTMKEMGLIETYYDYFGLKQVGTYAKDDIGIEEFAKILYTLSFDVMYSENIKINIEWNTYGPLLFKLLQTVYPKHNKFDGSTVLRYKHQINSDNLYHGLRLDPATKKHLCEKCRTEIGNERFDIKDSSTIDEFSKFIKKDNGTYSAEGKLHDDRCMACIDACAFFESTGFKSLVDEMYQEIITHDAAGFIDIETELDDAQAIDPEDVFWNEPFDDQYYGDEMNYRYGSQPKGYGYASSN
ncbi:MAG: hypothetical protein EOM74_00850 [Methanomicrobia archaeon]|nr:hypothetical protein [Methanomicrobia archaeon]